MTDLDNTQILTADESLSHDSSTIDTEASLTIISGTDSNTYQIGKETVIGRANPSDLVIPAPSLSKRHAKITFTNGQYFITDLESSNKTFHNKIQLQPNVCYALHNGDEIKFGDIICSFQEQTQSNKNTLSEPTYQTYVPAVNTLVEEDSPWPLDDDEIPSSIVTETNVDVIPSTQTISDSYDDQEPTQPMKIWNGNNHNTNRLSRTSMKNSEDVIPKQNGTNDIPSNKSASLISSTLSNSDDDDDNNLVIGAATLPATVPILIESTQINNDDQLEIVSSSQTKRVTEEETGVVTTVETMSTTTVEEVEIENTQAYDLEPTGEISSSDNPIADTQPYELESEQIVTDMVETKCEEVHKVVISGDKLIEEITTTTTTTTMIIENENPPTDTLAYELQPATEEITTTTTTKTETMTTIIENTNLPMQTLAYDLQPTNEQIDLDATAPAVCTDTQEYNIDEEMNDESPRPASETLEVVPVEKLVEQLDDAEKQNDDTTSKQQIEVIIDPDVAKMVAADEQMETNQSEISSTTNDDNKRSETTTIDKQQENVLEQTSNTSTVEQIEKINEENKPTNMEQESTMTLESEQKIDESSDASTPEETPLSIPESEENQQKEEEEQEENQEQDGEELSVSVRGQRGISRRGSRRGRGRRGGSTRARVVSTRAPSGRRSAASLQPSTNGDDVKNVSLEEIVNTETEELPKPVVKTPDVERKPTSSQTDTSSNVRVSARIKARASSGRNRQFPYTDDYVDLDDLEKQSKVSSTPQTSVPTTAGRRSTRGGRSSSAPQKRISLRQQPIDASASSDEKSTKTKDTVDVYDQMDTGGENEEPNLSTRSIGRKRKSTTPVSSTTPVTTKRTRTVTPQTVPVTNARRSQPSNVDLSTSTNTVTPKRGRKPTKTTEQAPEESASITDRPVRIALSSHLNFDQNHLITLRQLGFEIMDESCHVDALVVDRIRRTKKFFMCLARGAHILSPTWIEAMIKENRYIPYDKYYLEDTNAESRYGFQLRESVRLAKQRPIFENYKFFCTKDTSPPYEDLKDIVEAAGGKFIEKINMTKPGKDLICIVAQVHKNEYEDLYKKGVPIVSEEFALSGISKQKLDFEPFSLFQNAATSVKTTGKPFEQQMEKLPVEIFDLILAHLTLSDWKCLRLTSRTIYSRLSSFSSYSHIHSIILSPKSSSGLALLEKATSFEGLDQLSIANFNFTELKTFIQTSPSFRSCLTKLTSLSFASSTTLIDCRIFYELLSYCTSLEKLDLSNYKFFFLSHNFSQNTKIFPSVKQLNLNGNTHLSDYAFNHLMKAFPNIQALHLLGIPLRSTLNANENRTFLTFENICSYIQDHQEHLQALTLSFEPTLSCDTQIKRLFLTIPPNLTSFYIDGTLTISTLVHFLLLFDNHLQTLIVGRLKLDHTGCQPLFSAINEYATNLKRLCVFLNTPIKYSLTQQHKNLFSVLSPSSDISLSSLKHLNDLDIQTLYPLTEIDLINLFSNKLINLKKLALPRNTTDDVIQYICTQSSFVLSLTHLNLNNCSSLTNRSILLINKYLISLEELTINENININDFAFIGLSICSIGKSIEWLDQILINRQFVDDLPIWTSTITHQTLCKCQLPVYISSSCIKLRLKEINFNDDEYSDQILSILTSHKLFHEYFSSVNKLKKLKTLKLRQCIQLTNRLFRFGIRCLTNLKYLDISFCEKITDKNLAFIGQTCPSIETIDLTGCHQISEHGKLTLKTNAKRVKIIDY
ncbi:hypothetical protein I4U23_021272 [Adineta vaga]|nr:hypothetical protein I4U23_021272 [Adineta vaga]